MNAVETPNPIEYFDRSGLRQLSDSEIQGIANNYKNDLIAGLAGEQSSLAMFESRLSPVDLKTIPNGKQALIIEVGGTNLYGARVITQDGSLSITQSLIKPWQTKEYSSASEFFDLIARRMEPVISGPAPDAIGIVYSFRGEPIQTKNGVDVVSAEDLTKEFVIPGISDKPVGVAFTSAVNKNYTRVDEVPPVVVLNDTVAILFAGGARLGGVVGTGFNLAMDTPKGIVNTESGSFNLGPSHDIARAVDRTSEHPGEGLAEKQISGDYLGEQIKKIMRDLRSHGMIIPFSIEDTTSEAITDLLKYDGDDQVMLRLKEASVCLRDRSAQIVGTMIGVATQTFIDTYGTDGVEKIPIEGSVFWKVPGYHDQVLRAASYFSPKEIEFLNIDQAGRIGAAVAGLSFIK